MAISFPHYQLFKQLCESGEVARGGSVLQIGEANLYGDVPYDLLFEGDVPPGDSFQLAKRLYAKLFAPSSIESADFSGPTAVKADLNVPMVCGEHDLVVNHGTAEHVFNVANVFRIAHDACKPGGLMIHEAPVTWLDHGFYNLQPCLFLDLAAANGYDVRMVALLFLSKRKSMQVSPEMMADLVDIELIPPGAELFVAFRKTTDAPFVVPIQGKYQKAVA